MKQSKINKFFSPGKITPTGKPLFPRTTHSNSGGSSGEMFYNVNLLNADPMVIYEKIREREKYQARNSCNSDVRPTSVESDLSSQSSSQQLFHNSQLFEGSQTILGSNSSHSDDSATWYQQWINKPQNANMFRNQPDVKPFKQNRNSGKQSSVHSQEYKQYLDAARKKSKEKEGRDMLQNFLTLAKEYCEEAKATTACVSEKIDQHLSESSITKSLTNEKLNQMVNQLKGLENLLQSKQEFTDKIAELEKCLVEKNKENDDLRRELDEVRRESDKAMLEKLAEAFDKGQQLCSDKIEELFVNTSEIKDHLKKTKLTTADMWSQYSPRLAMFPTLQIAKPNEVLDLSNTTVNVSPVVEKIIHTGGENIPFGHANGLNSSQYLFNTSNFTCESSTSCKSEEEETAKNCTYTTISTLHPFVNTKQLAQTNDSWHREKDNTVQLRSLENIYTFIDCQSPSTSKPFTRSAAAQLVSHFTEHWSNEADEPEKNAGEIKPEGNKAKGGKAVKKRAAKRKRKIGSRKKKKNRRHEEAENNLIPKNDERQHTESVCVEKEDLTEPSFSTVVRKATVRSWFLDSDEESTNTKYLLNENETFDSSTSNNQKRESRFISILKHEKSVLPCFPTKEMLSKQGDKRFALPAVCEDSTGFGDLFG